MKKFRILWYSMTAVYLFWLLILMKWDTYTVENTLLEKAMYSSQGAYYAWIVFSGVLMLMFTEMLRRIYFAKKLGKTEKIFCLVSLVAGCAYITAYGFLENPLESTASMMGLRFPWLFKFWCVFSSVSVFANTLYMYRKNNYKNDTGIILSSVGCAALFVTVSIPSAGEDLVMTLQCLAHWLTALIFALLGAAGIVIFLVAKCREKNKRYIVLTVIFCAVLALMLVLLVTVGKNGLIENLPMWAAYIVLYLVNFTSLFANEANPEVKRLTK